ncbi:LytR C-terminal domain-containing protein [bacterium]|nr:LytR C-terminal domain-containing protein [bacterium]
MVVIVIGFLFLIPWLAGFITVNNSATETRVPDARESIKVEVLNGCGAEGIAGRFASYLRQNGIDVISPENAASFGYPKTLVLDHRGTHIEADSVARALGIEPDQVILQRKEGIADATVIIGKDYHKFLTR